MTRPWYKEGLPFQCTGCGKCCTGSSGVVWISEEEIHAVSKFLNLPVETVCRKYVRKLGDRLALLEVKQKNGDYDCIFLEGKQCSIYPVRPKQCKTFPWWEENLSSKEAWEEAGILCEGINHPEAPIIPLKEIEEGLK